MGRSSRWTRRCASPRSRSEILAWWREADVFARSLALARGRPEWIFYEGPPTANGKPGHPPRRAADVQGRLPAVQDDDRPPRAAARAAGTATACRSSSRSRRRSAPPASATSRRSASRSSTSAAASPCSATSASSSGSPSGSASGSTCPTPTGRCRRRVHRVGVVVAQAPARARACSSRTTRSRRTARGAAPRCRTPRSRKGYETRRRPERRSCASRSSRPPTPRLVGASLLVWTTTPWTLPVEHGRGGRRRRRRTWWCERRRRAADRRRSRWRGRVLRRGLRRSCGPLTGRRSSGARTSRPTRTSRARTPSWPRDFVSMDDGTGIVHLAPAFGPDDLAVGRAQGWPVFKPVGDDGTFTDDGARVRPRGRS